MAAAAARGLPEWLPPVLVHGLQGDSDAFHAALADGAKLPAGAVIPKARQGEALGGMPAALLEAAWSPLHLAVLFHRSVFPAARLEVTLSLLVAGGAEVDAATAGGVTPLTLAAATGHAGAVATLLRAGAEADGPPGRIFSPLLAAVGNGHAWSATLLLRGGADASSPGRVLNLRDAVTLQGRRVACPPVTLATPLALALAWGAEDCVDPLLAAGADVNGAAAWPLGQSAAERAAHGAATAAAALLPGDGCPPSPAATAWAAKHVTQLPPPFFAAVEAGGEALRKCFEAGPPLDSTRDAAGCSPLLALLPGAAGRAGVLEVLEALLTAGADVAVVDDGGRGVLALALGVQRPGAAKPPANLHATKRTAVVEVLLVAGADVNATYPVGRQGRHGRRGRARGGAAAAPAGECESKGESKGEGGGAPSFRDRSVLEVALEASTGVLPVVQKAVIVRRLLAAGARVAGLAAWVAQRAPRSPALALLLASALATGQVAMADELVAAVRAEHGEGGMRAVLATPAPSPEGKAAGPLLFQAAQSGREVAVRRLLKLGAPPNAGRPSRKARGGAADARRAAQTPLHAAARAGHVGVVAALLEAGAEVNAGAGEGETPLHAAIVGVRTPTGRKGVPSPAVVRLLLAAGADVTLPGSDGRLPVAAVFTPDTSGSLRDEHVAVLQALLAADRAGVAVRPGARQGSGVPVQRLLNCLSTGGCGGMQAAAVWSVLLGYAAADTGHALPCAALSRLARTGGGWGQGARLNLPSAAHCCSVVAALASRDPFCVPLARAMGVPVPPAAASELGLDGSLCGWAAPGAAAFVLPTLAVPPNGVPAPRGRVATLGELAVWRERAQGGAPRRRGTASRVAAAAVADAGGPAAAEAGYLDFIEDALVGGAGAGGAAPDAPGTAELAAVFALRAGVPDALRARAAGLRHMLPVGPSHAASALPSLGIVAPPHGNPGALGQLTARPASFCDVYGLRTLPLLSCCTRSRKGKRVGARRGTPGAPDWPPFAAVALSAARLYGRAPALRRLFSAKVLAGVRAGGWLLRRPLLLQRRARRAAARASRAAARK